MASIFKKKLKVTSGNGAAGTILLNLPDLFRIHKLQFGYAYAGGTNTIAGAMSTISEIRLLEGTQVIRRLTGTQLRDWNLLHGTAYDFNGVPNTGDGVTVMFPFAPEWYIAGVADSLALNPSKKGVSYSVEIDTTAAATIYPYVWVSNDAATAVYGGKITQEVLAPSAAGTDYFVSKEIKPKGILLEASLYAESGGQAVTKAGVQLGDTEFQAFEDVPSAENTDDLERMGLAPAASGRTTSIYDIVPVMGDALSHGWDLAAWGLAKMRIQFGSAAAGNQKILLTRVEA